MGRKERKSLKLRTCRIDRLDPERGLQHLLVPSWLRRFPHPDESLRASGGKPATKVILPELRDRFEALSDRRMQSR